MLRAAIFVTGAAIAAAGIGAAPTQPPLTPSTQCQAQLDAYCNADKVCSHALGVKHCNVDALYARFDVALDTKSGREWRCYSSSSLTPDRRNYSSGGCYCTQQVQLAAVLAECESGEDLVDVFTSGEEGYFCYRIPSMVHVGDEILVFAEGRKYTCADHNYNDIVMKRSTDGGRTWSALQKVYGESDASRNVTIGNGAPVLLRAAASSSSPSSSSPSSSSPSSSSPSSSSSSPSPSSPGLVLLGCRNNQLVIQLDSADLGRTWSAPKNVTSAVHPDWTFVATGPPQGLQLDSGRLVVGCDHIDGAGNWGSQVVYSDDAGATWTMGPDLPDGNECQVAQLHNGSLLVNMRARDKTRHFSWSDDDGATWSPPTAVPFAPHAPLGSDCEGSTVVLPGDTGRAVFSTPFSRQGRDNLTLFVSDDGGHSWVPRVQVDAGPAAYSALNALNESHVQLVYEAGGYARIRFGVFDVSA